MKGYLGGLVSKIINSLVKKKMGFDPEVNVIQFDFRPTDEGMIQVNMVAEMSQAQFDKLMEVVIK